MKIGIMTFWWSEDNYGQLLQCYALQKYLQDLGHDAYLIRYNWENDIKKNTFFQKVGKVFNPIILSNYIKNRLHRILIKSEQQKNNRKFSEFRNTYIKQSELFYFSYEELLRNSPEADVYIVGSDQVWNNWNCKFERYKKPLHAYFLDFGNTDVKRFSYAASWGRNSLSQEYINEITPLLQKFDYVSVREKSGIELCKQCGNLTAEWVCDPTLLLTDDKYKELYKNEKIRKPSKKYLLLYMLNNECDFDIETVYKFALDKALEVVYVTGNGVVDKKQKYFVTIPEWLYLVEHAQYVITNSFHCGVFSTIFHKQFGIIPLTGKNEGMNSRFDSLFSVRNIDNRYLKTQDFSVLDKEYICKDIQVSKNFINQL